MTKGMIFYPQYCFACGLPFISKHKHSRCWSCNSTNTINCFGEKYEQFLQRVSKNKRYQE